ncbi:MAG: HAD-IIA family hydrolase [Microlunatus sp.]|nr:HAD-IIA family hydrolase [Microlunatus sp.]MDN5770326.1 HAD-IIA family hydrolase [Microlunatus sp.]
MTALIDDYDTALFDLDGVVYLGPAAVDGAADGLRALRNRGTRVGFVTNNAARPPAAVAEHLKQLGIAATAHDIVTSAQAGAELAARRVAAGSKVLAVGGDGVWQALEEVGLVGVGSAEDRPVAVLQGFGFDLTWNQLNEAAIAIHRGAHWVATNTDPTRPTERGIVPGNGAAVDAVRQAVDVDPEVAGKPYRPLVEATITRLDARHPIFVGDRLDTDIAGAATVGIDSMLVLSGTHGAADLVAADPGTRPTHLGFDLRELLRPARVLAERPGEVSCGRQTAVIDSGRVALVGTPQERDGAVDALWATANLCWRATDLGWQVDPTPAIAMVSPVLSRR